MEHGAEDNKDSNCPVIIVNRQYCYEISKELPIAKIDEAVKAAANIDNIAPFDGVTFFVVEKSASEKCRVTFFVIQKKVYEHYSQFGWFIIPESMLLKLALDKNQKAGMSQLNGTWGNRQIIAEGSETGFKSYVVEKGQLAPLYFSQREELEQHIELQESDYQRFLLKGLGSMKGYMVKQALNVQRAKSINKQIPWLQGALTVFSLGLLYLVATSSYILLKTSSVESQLAEQREEINQVFSLKQQIDEERAQLEQIMVSEQSYALTAPVWKVFFDLLEKENINILSVKIESGDIVIRTKSRQATDVLEQLSEMERVLSPQITSPIVKSGRDEIITVKFRVSSGSDVNDKRNEVASVTTK